MPTKKTIVVPCMVNNWLNVSGRHGSRLGQQKLQAHHDRLDPGDHEEDHGHEDVHDADLLVIDGGHPLVQQRRPRRALECRVRARQWP